MHAIPEIFGYEIASETIFGSIRCFSEARRQVHMYEYLPFLPIVSYNTGFGFLIVRLSRKSCPLQMRLARLIVCLEEQKVVGRKTRMSIFCTVAAIAQVSTCHLCAWGGLAWASDEQWR